MRCAVLGMLTALVMAIVPAGGHAEPAFEDFFREHSMPMMIIAVDDGEILRANPAAENFYGFPSIEGMNINEINLLTPQQIEQEMKLAATSQRNHLFFRHRLGDGQVRVMGVYSKPFSYDGRDTLISAVYDTSDFDPAAERHYIARVEEQVDLQTGQLRDAKALQFWLALTGGITQTLIIAVLVIVVLRLRRASRENTKLVEEISFRNRELERLGDVMAHHFQEPSRRLVSLTQQLSAPAGDRESGKAVVVDFIQDQARKLSDLVSDVQRYLGLDRTTPVMSVLDTPSVLAQSYEQTDTLRDMRQEATLEQPEALPPVYFDHRRLVLIFRILLHNAWTYRRHDRPLVVRVTARTHNQRIEICVADNGTGIAPEYRQQALGLFTRVVPNASSPTGTGMGLALVAKALRPVGGHVRIDDGIDGGTAVIFDLPAGR